MFHVGNDFSCNGGRCYDIPCLFLWNVHIASQSNVKYYIELGEIP